MKYKIGTRGSKLALRQTEIVIEKFKELYPEDNFDIEIITTTGDKNTSVAIDKLGGRGVFVDEIEKALIENRIQLAVHSMKDMPVEIDNRLIFAKAMKREDPRDVLILREAHGLDDLRYGAIIATCSKRRAFQLLKIRPDIEIVDIRGNIDTRLRKMNEPMSDGRHMDGMILAAAGIKRLNLQDKISHYFSPEDMVPSPCQGILAVELRADNKELLEKLNRLSDENTQRAAVAERDFLRRTGGNCHLPVGAYLDTDNNIFYSLFGNEDGSVLDIKRERYE